MMVRGLLGTTMTLATIAVGSLTMTACSSGSSQSLPNCTASATWSAVPSNFDAAKIAARLGVSADQVRRGSYGPATCAQSISEDAIGSSGLIVNVKGHVSRCLIIGTQDEPVTGASTKDILAVCAASAPTS